MKILIEEKRYISTLCVIVMTLFMLTACGDDKTPEGQTYQQTIALPAMNAEQNVLLINLEAEISEVENTATWLTATKQIYTYGSPTLKIVATDNVKEDANTESRSCTLTVTAVSGDRVLLTVMQDGAKFSSSTEEVHDIQSDEPAYSRR